MDSSLTHTCGSCASFCIPCRQVASFAASAAGFEMKGAASAVLVDSDEIYIAGFYANGVVVLQLAGSEA